MLIHIIAAVAGDMALDGFRASKLDRRWFRAATYPTALWEGLPWSWYMAMQGQILSYAPGEFTRAYNAVIVGRKTFQDDLKGQPLGGRHTIVLSRMVPESVFHFYAVPGPDSIPCQRIWYCGSLESALTWADELGCPHAWIAGGAEVYRQALKRTDADLYLTTIDDDAPRATVYMPDLSGWRTEESTGWLQDDSRRIRIDRMVRE